MRIVGIFFKEKMGVGGIWAADIRTRSKDDSMFWYERLGRGTSILTGEDGIPSLQHVELWL